MSDPHATLVHHLSAVHRALERLFARASEAVDGPMTDSAWFDGVGAATTALHAHHLFEEEVMLPLVVRKGAEGPWSRLGEDHEELAAELALLGRAADLGDRKGTRTPVQRIAFLLPDHDKIEDDALTESFWRDLLTADEARAFGKQTASHSREHNTPATKVLPLLLYNMTEGERATFTARMPGFVTEGLVPFAFRPMWRSLRPLMSHPPRRLFGR